LHSTHRIPLDRGWLWATVKIPETENAMEGKMQVQKIEMEIVGGPPPSLEEMKVAEIARLQLLIELLKEDLQRSQEMVA
jgi:hypothetical protein